jgi:hypothetical protein
MILMLLSSFGTAIDHVRSDLPSQAADLTTRVTRTKSSIDEDRRAGRVGDDDSCVGATERSPRDVRGSGTGEFICNEAFVRGRADVLGCASVFDVELLNLGAYEHEHVLKIQQL